MARPFILIHVYTAFIALTLKDERKMLTKYTTKPNKGSVVIWEDIRSMSKEMDRSLTMASKQT